MSGDLDPGQRARVSVGSGGYTINGVKMRRTTRVIGAVPRPALDRWKRKTVIREALKLAPGLANIDIDAAVKVVANKRTEPSDAMLAGTRIHQCIEDAVMGNPHRNPDALTASDRKKAKAGWAWWKRYMHRGCIPELTVFNPETMISGTVDLWDPVTPCICDWKTGKGLYDTNVLQLILYGRHMTRCVVPDKDHSPLVDHVDGIIQRWSPEKAGDLILIRLTEAGNALAKVIRDEVVQPGLDVINALLTILAWSEMKTSNMWDEYPKEAKK